MAIRNAGWANQSNKGIPHPVNIEGICKRFYSHFKNEHTLFFIRIQGIVSGDDCSWYASLLLNRLMFVYFIQKRGFLDNDLNYLPNHLRLMEGRGGNDCSFYRDFLLHLFHKRLGTLDHSPELNAVLGQVPYLNVGLFDVHELERDNPGIHIPDQAFKRIFDFFDAYQWHLGDGPPGDENEINPDVLGYIFEKYINQKQMGAYYTKEDITEYISKNSIIPYLFNAVEKSSSNTLKVIADDLAGATQASPLHLHSSPAPTRVGICQELAPTRVGGRQGLAIAGVAGQDGFPWQMLKEQPDRYIYDIVKKGVELPLPAEIAPDLHDVSRRSGWNKPAPGEYALPGETWREVVSRRKRYEAICTKLQAGEIRSIDDLITYNLDIRRYAQDVIENCQEPELLWAFYTCISQMKVLDPTCGSGAFLLAALNILERLYKACLERMRAMMSDRERLREHKQHAERETSQEIFAQFYAVLSRVEEHPNQRFFILKSIMLNNLYGVDIMREAIEICKLRLYLKLVAQVERVKDLNALPNIDFNYHIGNTLVGFACHDEVEKAVNNDPRKLVTHEVMQRIEQKAREVGHYIEHFRRLQAETPQGSSATSEIKRQVCNRLNALNTDLDLYLAGAYGAKEHYTAGKSDYTEKLERRLQNYRPFHWFAEFYAIMESGGFDVIIGNPPYVASNKVQDLYRVRNYQTGTCGNLYAYTMERSLQLLRQEGYFGMIVPVSSVSSERYKPLIEIFLQRHVWLSSYSNRPGKLFTGVEQRLTIFIVKNVMQACLFTASYQHWYETERAWLFDNLSYSHASLWAYSGMPLKSGSPEAEAIFARLTRHDGPLVLHAKLGGCSVWVHNGPTYWVRALSFEPNSSMKSERSNHYLRIPVRSRNDALILSALLNSSTFYFYFKMVSNCRDLVQKEWATFPFGNPAPETLKMLAGLGGSLEKCLQSTAEVRTRHYPGGHVRYEEYYPARAKFIIDEIDRVLAQHYGFTDEELDFILNYDVKYRMGQERELFNPGMGKEEDARC